MNKNQNVELLIVRVEKRIEELTMELDGLDGYAQEYNDIVSNITSLNKVRTDLTESKVPTKLSKVDINTVISGVVGIASILLVTKYEETDIVTSKAVNIAMKWLGK